MLCPCGQQADWKVDLGLLVPDRGVVAAHHSMVRYFCKPCGMGTWRPVLAHMRRMELPVTRIASNTTVPWLEIGRSPYRHVPLYKHIWQVLCTDGREIEVRAPQSNGLGLWPRSCRRYNLTHLRSGKSVQSSIKAKWRAERLLRWLVALGIDWEQTERQVWEQLQANPQARLAMRLALLSTMHESYNKQPRKTDD
jgi:hypothetical protein